ncbi:MAG: DMT family transporter [Alphaproteobacteria bacterium]
MSQAKGNIIGIIALILWSCSALFFSYAEPIPTFLLISIASFLGGFLFVVIWTIQSPHKLRDKFKVPLMALLVPMIGIGLYDVFYYFAFKNAPIEEANIINYLWPTFILLFSALLPEHTLKPHTIIGALICFIGVCVLRIGTDFSFSDRTIELGHILALLAALTWGGYSVLVRFLKHNASNAVPVAFLYNAVIFMVLHLCFEDAWIISQTPLIAALALGIIFGAGYFSWNIAMSYGDIQLLSVLSYFTPISSTFLLVTFGYPVMTSNLMLSVCIIVIGTFIASAEHINSIYKRYRSITPS